MGGGIGSKVGGGGKLDQKRQKVPQEKTPGWSSFFKDCS